MTQVVPGSVRTFTTVFVLVMIVCSTLGQAGINAAAQTSVTKTAAGTPLPPAGDVIVVLKRSEITASADFAAAQDIETTYTYSKVLNGFAANLSNAKIRELAGNPAVLNVVKDYPVYISAQPVPTQIRRTGIDRYAPAGIDGVDNGVDVDIAILDTGIDEAHPDLNVMGGANCVETDYRDNNGHGTHVAGIAAARDNGIGVVGAAPGARLWAIKNFDATGRGSASTIICGLEVVMEMSSVWGIDVINMSFGATRTNADVKPCYSGLDPTRDAICQVAEEGITMVAAAGNESQNAAFVVPAKYPEVLAVGAISDFNGRPSGEAANTCGSVADTDDRFASYSNYGYSVDIVAPGTCILSSVPYGSGYDTYSGTSMASPLVAGTAALYKAQNPSASPGSVRSWLLSAASAPATSSNGYVGASYRLLHLGGAQSPVTNYPGVKNPVFSGTKATISNAFDSPSSSTAMRVRDNNPATSWSAPSDTPETVTLTVDVGRQTSFTGIKWRWGSLTSADQFTVSTSTIPSGPWAIVGQFTNGTSTGSWFGATTNNTGRFVRFSFSNPNQDATLGGIGEVEVWHRTDTVFPSGGRNPQFNGVKIPLTNSYDSPKTGRAKNVRDGAQGTNWSTSQNTPGSATITVDLGSMRRITGIRWLWTNINYGDQFEIQYASKSGGPWNKLGPFGNGTATYTWFGISTQNELDARFVRFVFRNPNNDFVIGGLGEVEVFGRPPGDVLNPPGDRNPSISYTKKINITNVIDSPRTFTVWRVKDGIDWTNWAVHGQPTTATIIVDLGSVHPVELIRWMMSSVGYADQFSVDTATQYDGKNGNWERLGTFGNPATAKTWYGFRVPWYGSVDARYVRFTFTNINGDSALGAVSEIEIREWEYQGASAASNPTFAGSVLEIEESQATGGDAASSEDSSVSIAAASAEPVMTVLETEANDGLTGVRWMSAGGIPVTISTSADGTTWTPVTSVTTIDNGDNWQGVALRTGADTRFVRVEAQPGSNGTAPELAGVEIWGLPDAAASPEVGTPVASPEIGTPIVTEVPAGTPDASPVVTEEPTAAPASPVVTEQPTEAPASPVATDAPATPVATEEPASTPTEEPADAPATPVVTGEPTTEPTEEPETPVATGAPTEAPTEEPTLEPTAEPTAAVVVGTITGTDGDLVNCRVSPVDGDPITQLAEGDAVAITGEPVDGWYPVTCAGQDGWVSEAFIAIGEVVPTEPVATEEGTPEATEAADGTEEPTADVLPTEEPTEEVVPTEEPVLVQPYEIVDTGDTEDSGTAWNTQDDDPSTDWMVSPVQAPERVRLYVDLGSVQPIDRLTFVLRTWDQLPVFEIWLSEDAETWYNVTPDGINGWNLPRDEELTVDLGYDARYVRIVIPDADESGLTQIGGIDDLQIWPGDITETALLGNVFAPTTPTPEDIPTEEPTAEVIPTEEPVVEEIAEPTEEPVVEEPDWEESTSEPDWEEPTAVPEGIEPDPTVEEAVG